MVEDYVWGCLPPHNIHVMVEDYVWGCLPPHNVMRWWRIMFGGVCPLIMSCDGVGLCLGVFAPS